MVSIRRPRRMLRSVIASLALSAFIIALTGAPQPAMAGTCTWTAGGISNFWGEPANWAGCVPAFGDSLVFPLGALELTSHNNLAYRSLASITFGDWYTLQGDPIQVGLITSEPVTSSEIKMDMNIANPTTIDTKTFGSAISVITISGLFVSSGGLTKTGGGVLVFCTTATYSGGTTITAGAIDLGCPGNLPDTGAVAIESDGRLLLKGANELIGALSGSGIVDGGGAILGIGYGGGSGDFSGAISDLGTLSYNGSGVQVMGGPVEADLFYVNSGTMMLNGSASRDVIVRPPATLGGSGSIGRDLFVEGILAPGASAGTLTIERDLHLLDGSSLAMELAQPEVAGGPNDFIEVQGSLTVDGSTSTS